MAQIIVESTRGLAQRIIARSHELTVDEPIDKGGDDAGPTPFEYLLAALGGCTSITLLMYAQRKNLALEKVSVRLKEQRINAADCPDCRSKDGFVTEITREIELTGKLTLQERQRLLEIAEKCPVHRALTAEIKVRDRLV